MHEVGLVEQAIKSAIEVAEAAKADAIDRLTFGISQGGHITPEAIEMLFQALSDGTPAEGAEVAFEPLQAEYGCWCCGQKFPSADSPEICPVCHGSQFSRLADPELVLKYVDVRTDA
ncbi:MAG: hydrogenase maturation nickel metallochaperone HypA, partial [Chloroflexi bacterium]|nr:hydrogenase maturation nickel metallochaperone HypA [Chloroflexota bacterium]